MKLLFALTAFAAFATVNPQLHEVKRVYILAMSASMDQYLADQITEAGVFEVVTDPKKADAIITDHVGESFERKLDDLYPPPATAKSVEETEDAGDRAHDSPKNWRDLNSDRLGGLGLTSSAIPGTTGRGRGPIFIVSVGGRAVLWSIYETPKNNSSGELTKTAEHVVKHLQEDLNRKKATTE
jgi:hypothetical protein